MNTPLKSSCTQPSSCPLDTLKTSSSSKTMQKSPSQSVKYYIYEEDIGDKLLDQCAKLFSEHYAVWGDESGKQSSGNLSRVRITFSLSFIFIILGSHVKMSSKYM